MSAVPLPRPRGERPLVADDKPRLAATSLPDLPHGLASVVDLPLPPSDRDACVHM